MRTPSHNSQTAISRFVAACQADERVVAAFLSGSHARGSADAYSDLDLGLITTDAAYDDFVAGREAFVRLLGEPLFLEDFDLPHIVFIVLADGAEVELAYGPESQFDHIYAGPCQILLDKKNLLAGAVVPWREPALAGQTEALRRLVYWFWHDLSHFTTAMGRGQLWWAYGQLEILRRCCVNLARLRHNFLDADVGEEAYFKVEKVFPREQLSALQATFCPMEPGAMLQAALVIVRFYRELASILAHAHGIIYPAGLDRVISDRLEILRDAHKD